MSATECANMKSSSDSLQMLHEACGKVAVKKMQVYKLHKLFLIAVCQWQLNSVLKEQFTSSREANAKAMRTLRGITK
jgi:hypothetical protein